MTHRFVYSVQYEEEEQEISAFERHLWMHRSQSPYFCKYVYRCLLNAWEMN